MDVTPRKRSKIVTLSEIEGKSLRNIASQCDVSVASVSRIVKAYREKGSFSPQRKGKCGRKRKTTQRDDKMLLRISVKNPKLTSSDIQKELSTFNVDISSSTVRRRLINAGRRARKPIRKQLLTNAMKKKRMKWAKDYKNWTEEHFKKVIFTDESHFEVQGQRCQFVRRSIGEPVRECHIEQRVKHPQKVMFWGSFTTNGPLRLVPVSGMMNSAKYCDLIHSKVAPDLRKEFPNGDGILQQDLAPCHTAKKSLAALQTERINVLKWPGNSPDLNPIENLWAIVKRKLNNYDCTTKDKLITAVIQIWYHDQEIKNKCSNLVNSMPKRVKMILKAKGGHIKY